MNLLNFLVGLKYDSLARKLSSEVKRDGLYSGIYGKKLYFSS
jgi:hypothetical protein